MRRNRRARQAAGSVCTANRLATGHLQQSTKLSQRRIVDASAIHDLAAKLAIFDDVLTGHIGDQPWQFAIHIGSARTRDVDAGAIRTTIVYAGTIRATNIDTATAVREEPAAATADDAAATTAAATAATRPTNSGAGADANVNIHVSQVRAAYRRADVSVHASTSTDARGRVDIRDAAAATDRGVDVGVDAAPATDTGGRIDISDRSAADAYSGVRIDTILSIADRRPNADTASVDTDAYTQATVTVSDIDSHRGRADRQHHGATSQSSGEFPETRHGFSPFGCIGCCAIASRLHQLLRIFTAIGFTKKVVCFHVVSES
ncbi:MAG: hypothetical protein AB7P20_06545 [Rhizobiaceae bacterium]